MKKLAEWMDKYNDILYLGFGITIGILFAITSPISVVIFCLGWSMFVTAILIGINIKLREISKDLIQKEKEIEVIEKARRNLRKDMIRYAVKNEIPPDDYLQEMQKSVEMIKQKAKEEIEKEKRNND